MRGMKPGCFYYRDMEMDMVVKENQKNLVIIKSQRQIKGVGLGLVHENGLSVGLGLDETHNIVDKICLLNNYYYYYIN